MDCQCPKCDSSLHLDGTEKNCPVCGAELIFCKSCGAPVAAGSRFCNHCGTPVANSSVPYIDLSEAVVAQSLAASGLDELDALPEEPAAAKEPAAGEPEPAPAEVPEPEPEPVPEPETPAPAAAPEPQPVPVPVPAPASQSVSEPVRQPVMVKPAPPEPAIVPPSKPKKEHKGRGFTIFLLVLMIILLIAAAGLAWYIWKGPFFKTSDNFPAQQTTQEVQDEVTFDQND